MIDGALLDREEGRLSSGCRFNQTHNLALNNSSKFTWEKWWRKKEKNMTPFLRVLHFQSWVKLCLALHIIRPRRAAWHLLAIEGKGRKKQAKLHTRVFLFFFRERSCHRHEVAMLRLKIILCHLSLKSPSRCRFFRSERVFFFFLLSRRREKADLCSNSEQTPECLTPGEVERALHAAQIFIAHVYKVHPPAVHTVQHTMRDERDSRLSDPEK